MTGDTVLEVVRARHEVLKARTRAVRELGLDDVVVEAQAVEDRELLVAILRAYRRETLKLTPLEARLRTVLHDAGRALDDYDLVRVEQALHDGLRAIWEARR